ncbi:MAG TPA: amidohydrolase family protein [Alphaproteobacteria bacterium]
MHVFGPFDRFPLAAERSYNVPEAPLAAHEAMKGAVGLERTVLVQASGCGTDNGAMLAALGELGPRGRGVVVVDAEMSDATLASMHQAGVRGVRLNLVTLKGRYGDDTAALIQAYARRLKPRGWHLQLFVENAALVALETPLAAAGIDIVVDHMGLPDARTGPAQPGFQALLRLLRRGHIWVKLAGADRVSRHTGRLSDAMPFMQALVETNVDRLVWGTDWPHIGFHSGTAVGHQELLPYRPLDAGELLDVLIAAVPDPGVREKILAANPARLYQFD